MKTMNDRLMILPVIAAVFFLGIMLTGCKTTGDIEANSAFKTKLDIPKEFFICEDATSRPEGLVIMESKVAKYVNSLEFVVKDCKSRLKGAEIIVTCHNDPDCKVEELIKTLTVAQPEIQR